MPTPTYDLIASNVLSTSASSVTFSSIPATYRDLVLVVTATAASNLAGFVRLNGSTTTSDYPAVMMQGTGSSTSSSTFTSAGFYMSYATGGLNTTRCTYIAQIMDYAVTDKHKTVLARYSDAGLGVEAYAGRFAQTSAVTSITLVADAGQFSSGSSFYLYGIVS